MTLLFRAHACTRFCPCVTPSPAQTAPHLSHFTHPFLFTRLSLSHSLCFMLWHSFPLFSLFPSLSSQLPSCDKTLFHMMAEFRSEGNRGGNVPARPTPLARTISLPKFPTFDSSAASRLQLFCENTSRTEEHCLMHLMVSEWFISRCRGRKPRWRRRFYYCTLCSLWC